MEIYIWGTGCGAGEVFQKGLNPNMVTAFVDSYATEKTFLDKTVLLPHQLKERTPDLILITSRHTAEICQTCEKLGISPEKLLFLKNSCTIQDRNSVCTHAEKILGKDLFMALLPEQYLVTAPDSLKRSALSLQNDFVRLAALELLTRRLQNIPGAMAELGVYKGNFAACMNKLMPERPLYLFDSFEGFDREEGEREMASGNCTDGFLGAHKNTSVQRVLQTMPYKESVILKPGFFPNSLQGLEENFALVSLDADLYETTLEGLRYFFPRLSPGGYLMLHDWGSAKLTGVSQALSDYEQELGHFLPAIPIPDIGSSLIIQKP